MKLSKLIPTVASLGVVMTAAPIAFTSCSCTNTLKDINIKNGYNPGQKQSPRHFVDHDEMNKEYLKLSSKDKAKDYIWSLSQTLQAAQVEGPTVVPFTFKSLTSAHVTMESWFTKPLYWKNGATTDTYIETSYQYIINVSGISGKSGSSYIPEGSEVNYEVNFEVSGLPYTFGYDKYKYEIVDTRMLVPAPKEILQSLNDWHVSSQVIATYKKKYSDTEAITKVDTIAVYWDHDNLYDESKEEEYRAKSYLYPIVYKHLFYKSYFFSDHTCDAESNKN